MKRLWVLVVLLLVGISVSMFLTNDADNPISTGPFRPTPKPDLPRIPRSMAALGDSITQAVNLGYGSGDPARLHSWATGEDVEDPVVSHLERLAAAGPQPIRAYNDSISGARMKDAARQARVAVSQRAEYVTFLMGANDVCAASGRSITSVRAFRTQFERAISTLVIGLHDPLVYVVSIPDVYRLWDVMHGNTDAKDLWRVFGTCGALLDERNTERDRLRVRQRVEEYNEVLQEVCERHESCHHDGGAVFMHPFESEDVSPMDFFHPSIAGQRTLAEVTWANGPFASLQWASADKATSE